MKNLPGIRIFSFVSLDGFICGPDGGMEWLTDCIPYTGEDYGFAEFRSGAGCVLMGGMYYAAFQASDFWPFGDRRCFVVAPHRTAWVANRERTSNTLLLGMMRTIC